MTPFTQIMTPFIIIATILLSIFAWEMLRSIYRKWFKEEPIKHYQPERHVYPKKDCECDCLVECKTPIKGSDIPDDGYLSERKFLRETHPLTVNIPGRFTSDENILMTNASCKYYMSRGNKRYFRGENVKVVVTVKGGGCENS